MKHRCSTIVCCAVVSWSAVAPASFSQSGSDDDRILAGPFQITPEIDADILAAPGEGLYADLRMRLDAEAVADGGLRWGAAFELASHAGDSRRGLTSRHGAVTPGPGLVTGLGARSGPSDPRAGFQRAEVYVRGSLVEAYAGLADTAARRDRPSVSGILRLAGADGGLVDPAGGALASTDVSLSEPAPHLTVRTRRLAGFSLSASYAPDADVCGVVRCRRSETGDIEDVAALSVSFDRRMPETGVRWRAQLAGETGQAAALAAPGPRRADPRLVSARLIRESAGVSLSLSALVTNDGRPEGQYRALAGALAVERGDWLFGVELAGARSDLMDAGGWTAQAGASRFVGSNGVAGLAVRFQDGGDRGDEAAILAETGLRF